jgi:hypothetical protein
VVQKIWNSINVSRIWSCENYIALNQLDYLLPTGLRAYSRMFKYTQQHTVGFTIGHHIPLGRPCLYNPGPVYKIRAKKRKKKYSSSDYRHSQTAPVV